MKRERYEARPLGWHVVRIAPDGTESTVEVWPEEKAKHRAEVLDQRAAESFEAERKLPVWGRTNEASRPYRFGHERGIDIGAQRTKHRLVPTFLPHIRELTRV